MLARRSVHKLFSFSVIVSLLTACGGQVEVVGASSSVAKKPIAKSIIAAYDHSCAVLNNGTVRCWGSNGIGQLGNGTYSDWSLPVTVVGITNPIGVAVGESYTCAVLSDGSIQCWGGNLYGQLGDMDHSYVPVTIPGITNAISIAAASDHTCVVVSDHSVQCWGGNGYGQLGNVSTETCAGETGHNSCSTVPLQVSGISNAVAVAAGFGITCVVLANGSVQCWGANGGGQLGNGTTIDSSVPVPVTGITNAVAVSTGSHTCAVLSDGTVQCWGGNLGTTGNDPLGPLGYQSAETCPTNSDYSYPCSTIPLRVPGVTNAVAVGDGEYHTCALLSNGTVECWGDDSLGELGNGTTAENSLPPVVVTTISNATAVATGSSHACAIANGVVLCWGWNDVGQLGNGTTTDSSVPVPVSGL